LDCGLDDPDLAGQRISPWFEVSLAASALTGGLEVEHCFGADNAFLYLCLDPATRLALHPEAILPRRLHANEYLLLAQGKMSTSRGVVLSPSQLSQMPSDGLRWSLARYRPERMDQECSPEDLLSAYDYELFERFQSWLAQLGQDLVAESGSKAPAAQDWCSEQDEFLAYLENWQARIRKLYEQGQLRGVTQSLLELVERSTEFAFDQAHLKQQGELLGQRQTGLALQLAVARLLALGSAAILPKFSQALWKHLGFRGEPRWSERVELLEPGQRILAAAGMGSRRYFPALSS